MLISDILSEVFEYLDDRDEILGSPNPKTYKLLIQTFLSCLDNSERQQLYNDGVYVPGGKYDLPVFNYPTFLKNLDYYEMISFVKSWCRFYLEDGTEESVSAILRSILKLFVARSAHLNTLSIRSTSCEEKYMLLTEPSICPLIKPLKNLYINCYSIDRLNTPEKNQRGLKRIILSRCKKFANIIIPSLEKQKRTLRHVGFRGIDFDGCCKWDILKYCSKLEKLDIVD
ncbi:1325_t:CDS:2, partial [Racocetra fulgida]